MPDINCYHFNERTVGQRRTSCITACLEWITARTGPLTGSDLPVFPLSLEIGNSLCSQTTSVLVIKVTLRLKIREDQRAQQSARHTARKAEFSCLGINNSSSLPHSYVTEDAHATLVGANTHGRRAHLLTRTALCFSALF